MGEGRSVALEPADASNATPVLLALLACLTLGALLGSVFAVRRRRERRAGARRIAVRLEAISGGR